MSNKPTKSVRSIFLRSQIFVSLTVMSMITAILTILLFSLANFIDYQRIIELSQSIESQARIAKSPQHLQHAITGTIYSRQALGIIVFSRDGNQVIAANSLPGHDSAHGWLVSDPEIRKKVHESLSKGLFGVHRINSSTHRITILPLAPPIPTANGRNFARDARWYSPDWHHVIGRPKLSPATLWPRILAVFNPDHSHNFKLRPDQYDGAIVLETSRNWVTSLVLRAVAVITILMALGVVIIMFFLSHVLRKKVLGPVHQYINVISSRRAGDYKSRVPVSNITEFDELAEQWNSLLDYRDVAQGQNMVLSTLLEHVPVGIDVIDAEGSIEYANPTFLKMTGYSLVEVIGQTPESLLTSEKEDQQRLSESLEAITAGKSWTGEMTYRRKDGSDMICNTTFVPILDRDNKLERLISVRLDITDLKEDQQMLIAAKTTAEAADRAKSEFLTNMSHELRTPLNAIIGFSEMMAAQKLGPIDNKEYIEFSRLIETSSRTLLSSINLILDLSRLDSQRLRLNKSEIRLSNMLHKVIESKTTAAHSMGVELKRDLNCKSNIRTDQRMMYQALGYLICNAIRYNHEGGEVYISVHETDDKIIISIRDTGIGISPENLQRITEPFFRVDSSFDRAKDGAGLSLALVKKFTDAQDIELDFESEVGKGTTVTMTLPVAMQESDCQPIPDSTEDPENRQQSLATG